MGHTTAELGEISEKLKAMIADHDSQIRLVIQTGYDETGVVATADGYLRLAQVLIEFVLSSKAQETETWDIYGHSLPGSTAINELFRENYEVCIDTTMLAETQEEINFAAASYGVLLSPLASARRKTGIGASSGALHPEGVSQIAQAFWRGSPPQKQPAV